MRLDTQPLLGIAERLAADRHLPHEEYARRRSIISRLEGSLVTKQEHVDAYEESRSRISLDGTALAWERWRAEHQLLTLARAEVERLESFIRLEMELLEREVALAQQRRARALVSGTEARA